MNLRGIVAVSGRPGLFKLVGQNKAGYVLESLDAQKVKIVANMTTTKLASLEDITVYGEDDDLKLTDVLANMVASKGNVPDAKAESGVLKTFFKEVAPGHDEEKVYASDMKKIVSWYHILKDLPLFTEEAPAVDDEHGLHVVPAHRAGSPGRGRRSRPRRTGPPPTGCAARAPTSPG